jgi:hypothetical protein
VIWGRDYRIRVRVDKIGGRRVSAWPGSLGERREGCATPRRSHPSGTGSLGGRARGALGSGDEGVGGLCIASRAHDE